MHADTGILAAVASLCMMLALVPAWCLAGVRSSRDILMTGLLLPRHRCRRLLAPAT